MLADSGYWLALASPRDYWHGAAVAATQELTGPLVVTWPVLTEASHLLLARGGVNAQTRFLGQISSHVEIHHLQRSHLPSHSLVDGEVSGSSDGPSRCVIGGCCNRAQ